jgi:hypothetical protein
LAVDLRAIFAGFLAMVILGRQCFHGTEVAFAAFRYAVVVVDTGARGASLLLEVGATQQNPKL